MDGQKAQLKKIAVKHRLKLIIAFGSQVTKNTHPGSDLDIAVLSRKNEISFQELTALTSALGKVFPGKEIDLCFINRADPLLLKKISETPILLYGRRRSFEEFRCYAFSRYDDYKPYFKLEELFVRDSIRKLSHAHR